MAKKKQIGMGSISLLLAILAILWSCNFAWWDGLCIGDTVLSFLGLPSWSAGQSRIHFTVFYSLAFLIPGFVIGDRNQKDKYAVSGKWINLVLAGYILVFPLFMAL